jgi:hypothetical protein
MATPPRSDVGHDAPPRPKPKNRIDEVAWKCEPVKVTNQAAYILRENTGTSGVVETARTAASAQKSFCNLRFLNSELR